MFSPWLVMMESTGNSIYYGSLPVPVASSLKQVTGIQLCGLKVVQAFSVGAGSIKCKTVLAWFIGLL